MTIQETCLKETDMAAYIEGRVSGDKLEGLERFLSENELCFEELLAVQRTLDSRDLPPVPEPPQPLMQKVFSLYSQKESFFDLVIETVENILKVLSHSNGTTVVLQDAALALRTDKVLSSQTVVITKKVDELEAKVEIERNAKACCIIKVSFPDDKPLRADHMRAEVLSEGRIIASELLKSGQAVFDVSGPGRYSIVFRKDRQALGEIRIRIKGQSMPEAQGGA